MHRNRANAPESRKCAKIASTHRNRVNAPESRQCNRIAPTHQNRANELESRQCTEIAPTHRNRASAPESRQRTRIAPTQQNRASALKSCQRTENASAFPKAHNQFLELEIEIQNTPQVVTKRSSGRCSHHPCQQIRYLATNYQFFSSPALPRGFPVESAPITLGNSVSNKSSRTFTK